MRIWRRKANEGGGDEDRDEEGRGIKVQGVGWSSMIYGQGLWVSHNLAGAIGAGLAAGGRNRWLR